jgi:hypothetical protein
MHDVHGMTGPPLKAAVLASSASSVTRALWVLVRAGFVDSEPRTIAMRVGGSGDEIASSSSIRGDAQPIARSSNDKQ